MNTNYVYAVPLADLQAAQMLTIQRGGHTIVLCMNEGTVYAVDNRCPHLGFPLDKGTVKDGILVCHWHHARFDLATGGTFDQWADDVRSFPVEIRQSVDADQNVDEIWVDLALHVDPMVQQRDRLQVGLERDIPLVIGKSVLTLFENGNGVGNGNGTGNGNSHSLENAIEPFRAGLDFGTRYRSAGWGQGLTMHVCMMNMLPYLEAEDQPRALYHGLSAVARDSSGMAPRFCVRPLPESSHIRDVPTLKRWFRQFVEVRDAEGAERCIVSAIHAEATPQEMADMMFAAVTDHRYIDIGHPADFTNKAFEALDIVGWDHAEQVLTSLAMGYANASRMEESNAWRYPIDLIAILDEAFAKLPGIVETVDESANGTIVALDDLTNVLLADDPQVIVDTLLDTLKSGCSMVDLAGYVAYAAALRIARFHTSNEFIDWDTALHTFTFANAIHQGLKRAPSVELLRGVFDAAMSIYLDRFLNIPAARLPEKSAAMDESRETLDSLLGLLNRQQQVNQSAQEVASYLYGGGESASMLATLGKLLLREDRDFHTIQSVETAFRQYEVCKQYGEDETVGVNILVAAIRYLAAHSPTVRAQGQTYQIAHRLHIGDHLFEG